MSRDPDTVLCVHGIEWPDELVARHCDCEDDGDECARGRRRW